MRARLGLQNTRWKEQLWKTAGAAAEHRRRDKQREERWIPHKRRNAHTRRARPVPPRHRVRPGKRTHAAAVDRCVMDAASQAAPPPLRGPQSFRTLFSPALRDSAWMYRMMRKATGMRVPRKMAR